MSRQPKKRSNKTRVENNNIQEKTFKSLLTVVPRNLHQKDYLDSIQKSTVTVGLGPAGSGKTYLAVYSALLQHFSKKKKRIIVTRPAIEAGEKLGFLPGDLSDKLDPYMRPIYDSLHDLIGVEATNKKVETKRIEIAPLAYMRGRTFNNCFVILDEAQNATIEQLKMILTRLGENCKLVIAGDPGQSDLPGYKKESGLFRLKSILAKTPDVEVIEFNKKDIVRSRIVLDVVAAFEEYEKTDKS